ncbi:VWA domain-containing protein [uncultured Paludibaculum sp.]|uniref:VWA domain-containing protein n=1 Tax=uncultured Paludibaculum sp. TaxID=1765020 RepID=UPI002AABECCF|nr:VWA domain-containing protein [uncultured Paludibaculum sp.]
MIDAFLRVALATAIVGLASGAYGQAPTVQVNVDLVQLEVVVTDSKGNPVTDLKADEMEVFENGRARLLSHFSYIPEVFGSGVQPPGPVAPPGAGKPGPAPAATPGPVSKAGVARVVAIVVDDLGMDQRSFSEVRRALDRFLARGVQSGDLVALVSTSGRFGNLARLTNDPRLLREALGRFNSIPLGRWGVRELRCAADSAFSPKNAPDADAVAEAHYSRVTLTTLRRVVDGLRGYPGRKSILLFSEGLRAIEAFQARQGDQPLLDQYDALWAHANRSGVSVNTIDPRGLVPTAATAEDVSVEDACAMKLHTELVNTQLQLAEIARRTAGVAIRDTNDLPSAIRRVMADQSGYYLVGWRPPEARAVNRPKGARGVRNISIRLKRPGLIARFHSSLYANERQDVTQADSAHRLADAMLSPFTATDIGVRVSSRYWDAGEPDGFVFDVDLLINAGDCKFAEENGGRRRAELHVIATIWGAEETPLDTFERSYTISLTPAAYERALADGLVQRLQMRVKHHGGYQIRAAVQDRQSERLGSASDFVVVPDLKRVKLALSGIALMGAAPAGGPDEGTRQRYRRGETVTYTFQIMSAAAGAEDSRRVEVRAALYRSGAELGTSQPVTVESRGQPDPKRWVYSDSFRIGDQLPAGDYTLQITVVDRAQTDKPLTATQNVDFEVAQ